MNQENKKVAAGPAESDDQVLDLALRPTKFAEYVGQENIKKNLAILVGAARQRGEPLEHILFHGPSGLGKTTLAYLVAREFGSSIRITSGTALEKAGDIGSILTGLSVGEFPLTDEVQRLNKAVEETLYPAMENYKLDIVIGKGSSAKTLEVKVPHFTLLAATTRVSMLSHPFRSRFGVHYKLDFYTPEDICQIVKRSAALLKVDIDQPALTRIAHCARATPRIANRLLKRVRDYAQVHNGGLINEATAQSALAMLGIDDIGLETTDRLILKTIGTTFSGGPVGVKAIAAAVAEEEDTIEEVYEPSLMQIGFLARTARGRVITDSGRKHVGLSENHNQNRLI